MQLRGALWDEKPRSSEVRLFNNLVLGSGSQDMHAVNNGGSPSVDGGPGDGPAFAAKWQMACNWREVKIPKIQDGWIPPKPEKDVRLDQIKDLVKDNGLVRPKADSPLATKGAGTFDPSLPRYVGALPPEGTSPWDWKRTWHAPLPGKLITVSKRKEDNATYDTLTKALAAAKPWTTIRVLDDSVYRETLILNRNEQFAGVRLEATAGATLEKEPAYLVGLGLKDVRGVSVCGFRFRCAQKGRNTFVLVAGECGDLVLENLRFDGKGPGTNIAVALEGPTEFSASSSPVLALRNCTFNGLAIGAWLLGNLTHEEKLWAGHSGPRHSANGERFLRLYLGRQSTRPARAGADRRQSRARGKAGRHRPRTNRHRKQADPPGEQHLRGVQLRGALWDESRAAARCGCSTIWSSGVAVRTCTRLTTVVRRYPRKGQVTAPPSPRNGRWRATGARSRSPRSRTAGYHPRRRMSASIASTTSSRTTAWSDRKPAVTWPRSAPASFDPSLPKWVRPRRQKARNRGTGRDLAVSTPSADQTTRKEALMVQPEAGGSESPVWGEPGA